MVVVLRCFNSVMKQGFVSSVARYTINSTRFCLFSSTVLLFKYLELVIPGAPYACWTRASYFRHFGVRVGYVTAVSPVESGRVAVVSTTSHVEHLAIFELVQIERPNFCQPRMPPAVYTRMSHTLLSIWYHSDRHEHWKRVTYS